MRYACITRRRKQYPVDLMCQLLTVSRSGYSAWRSRPESQSDRTPAFEHVMMWEIKHIRPLPLRTQRAVFCRVIDVA